MGDLISLKCDSCGGHLNFESNSMQYICENCGSKYKIKSTPEGIALEKIEKILNDLPIELRRNNAELALVRLEKELKQGEQEKLSVEKAKPIFGCSFIFLLIILLSIVIITQQGTKTSFLIIIADIFILAGTIFFIYFSLKGKKKRLIKINSNLKKTRHEIEVNKRILEEY